MATTNWDAYVPDALCELRGKQLHGEHFVAFPSHFSDARYDLSSLILDLSTLVGTMGLGQ